MLALPAAVARCPLKELLDLLRVSHAGLRILNEIPVEFRGGGTARHTVEADAVDIFTAVHQINVRIHFLSTAFADTMLEADLIPLVQMRMILKRRQSCGIRHG